MRLVYVLDDAWVSHEDGESAVRVTSYDVSRAAIATKGAEFRQ